MEVVVVVAGGGGGVKVSAHYAWLTIAKLVY